jgi:6-phosphofructokinase 1
MGVRKTVGKKIQRVKKVKQAPVHYYSNACWEGTNVNRYNQKDFNPERLGECKFDSPLVSKSTIFSFKNSKNERVIFENTVTGDNLKKMQPLTFIRPIPQKKIFFCPSEINVGIVTCGGLCPGVNNVIRSITYSCLDNYGVKAVFGFRYGFQGLTKNFHHEAVRLSGSNIDSIHEQGGTILSSSRGAQDIGDMVDTLVRFNISILFVIGGDGTQKGSMALAKEIKKRKLFISIVGIPKTIDNDISFTYKTFGFDTAVEEARKTIDRAHIESKGARNGIGLVKLMGRYSGFIAAHAALASGNANMVLIPEEEFDLDNILARIEKRMRVSDHMVIVVAEGVGQEFIKKKVQKKNFERDPSGNIVFLDIGVFLKQEIVKHLEKRRIPHTLKYIDPSYMIRSTPANGIDSSLCLLLGNFAVHAAMAGYTNILIGFWNQHHTIVPIKLALASTKQMDLESAIWSSIKEITV